MRLPVSAFAFFLFLFCGELMSQPSVLIRKHALSSVNINEDRAAVRQLFPQVFQASDSLLWIGMLPAPALCNGNSGRIEIPPGISGQDMTDSLFYLNYSMLKIISMPREWLNGSAKDPLSWRPTPIYKHYFFLNKNNPASSFSFSVLLSKNNILPDEPVAFLGKGNEMVIMAFSTDSVYSCHAGTGKVQRNALPMFRGAENTALILPPSGDYSIPYLNAAQIIPRSDWSLFSREGERKRKELYQRLTENIKSGAGRDEIFSSISGAISEAGVIQFEDKRVNEGFKNALSALYMEKQLSDAERYEKFRKICSQTGKEGFKSMMKNPVWASPLMWSRDAASGTDRMYVSAFEPVTGKCRTWMMNPFSGKAGFEQLEEKSQQILWQKASGKRDLNKIWASFFEASYKAERYTGLFPDLFDY